MSVFKEMTCWVMRHSQIDCQAMDAIVLFRSDKFCSDFLGLYVFLN